MPAIAQLTRAKRRQVTEEDIAPLIPAQAWEADHWTRVVEQLREHPQGEPPKDATPIGAESRCLIAESEVDGFRYTLYRQPCRGIPSPPDLTPREREVVRLVANGLPQQVHRRRARHQRLDREYPPPPRVRQDRRRVPSRDDRSHPDHDELKQAAPLPEGVDRLSHAAPDRPGVSLEHNATPRYQARSRLRLCKRGRRLCQFSVHHVSRDTLLFTERMSRSFNRLKRSHGRQLPPL